MMMMMNQRNFKSLIIGETEREREEKRSFTKSNLVF